VDLVRSDVSEEPVVSNFRGEKREREEVLDVPPKRRFLQDPHDANSKKTEFFIVTTE
jgi:hypothetical protein